MNESKRRRDQKVRSQGIKVLDLKIIKLLLHKRRIVRLSISIKGSEVVILVGDSCDNLASDNPIQVSHFELEQGPPLVKANFVDISAGKSYMERSSACLIDLKGLWTRKNMEL